MSDLDLGTGGWVLPSTLVALLIVSELGYRLGCRHGEPTRAAAISQADTLVPALLGLLGLLLAFSFDVAQTRFDRRRQLVLDDANAIGTTYLRAKTLPPPYDARIQVLLRAYVADRVGGANAEDVQEAIVRSGAVHDQLWAETTEVARANPDSEIVGRFIESLNNMIDLHEARITVAFFQRMPRAILWMLLLVSVFTTGMVGFRSGLDRARSLVPVGVLLLTITAVLAMIVDLDRPASRMFQISQRAMQDVARTMSEHGSIDARRAPPPR